jgi:hypothetical protein
MTQMLVALSIGVLALAIGSTARAQEGRDESQRECAATSSVQREAPARTEPGHAAERREGGALEAFWEDPVYVPPIRGAPGMRIGGGSRGTG